MDPLFSIPAPRRSARIAAAEARRTPGEVAEELYTAMLALKDMDPEDLPVLYKSGYLADLGYDCRYLHRTVRVSLKTRRLFNRLLPLWAEYNDAVDDCFNGAFLYRGTPDGIQYIAWTIKMKDQAYLSFTSFIYHTHNYTIEKKEEEW
jgi:hypothetical protein